MCLYYSPQTSKTVFGSNIENVIFNFMYYSAVYDGFSLQICKRGSEQYYYF